VLERLPDERLMGLAQRGDKRAFEALVERHRPAVSAAAHFTCGPDLVDDVVQVAFVALWRHRDQYRPDRGSLRGWLLTIVRHRAIDLVRSRAARQRHIISMDPQTWTGLADEASVAEAPDMQVERWESGARVRLAVEELPADQREVIELAYFAGLSQQEIAARLSIPLGTVKGRTRLGLDKLRAGWSEAAAPAAAEPLAIAA
jgi:RNA polymerase sigma-70 factor (ECF subfamily)